jgi:hypothetical protein
MQPTIIFIFWNQANWKPSCTSWFDPITKPYVAKPQGWFKFVIVKTSGYIKDLHVHHSEKYFF